MKILLLGTDNFTATSLSFMVDNGYNVVAVITHNRNNNGSKLQDLANFYNIPYYILDDINSKASYELILNIEPDIIFLIHFDRIIHKNIYSIAKICAISMHPSLLPKYKGITPFQRVLLNNEKETGVTIYHIVDNIDAGNIIVQKHIKLNTHMYLPELVMLMMNTYPLAIKDALQAIESGNYNGIEQDNTQSSYYGRIRDDEYIISENESIIDAYNKIRAFSRLDKGARLHEYIINWSKIMDMHYNGSFSIHEQDTGILIKFVDGTLFVDKLSYKKIQNTSENMDISLQQGEETICIIRVNDILTAKNVFLKKRKKYSNLITLSADNSSKKIYYVECIDSSFFVLDKGNFYKTYFLSSNIDMLQFDLICINVLFNKPNIIEIVYRDSINIYEKVLIEAGYTIYGGLIKLIKKIQNNDLKEIDTNVIYAQKKYINEILENYENTFEQYIDGIMTKEKLCSYIENKQVLVYVDYNRVLGCIIYTPKQRIYHLNYWFITKKGRAYKGIGGALLHKLFDIAGQDNYIEAWCKKDNLNALAIYKHYNFIYDNLDADTYIKIS